eukprot:4179157-Amphidinium_carterae.1
MDRRSIEWLPVQKTADDVKPRVSCGIGSGNRQDTKGRRHPYRAFARYVGQQLARPLRHYGQFTNSEVHDARFRKLSLSPDPANSQKNAKTLKILRHTAKMYFKRTKKGYKTQQGLLKDTAPVLHEVDGFVFEHRLFDTFQNLLLAAEI